PPAEAILRFLLSIARSTPQPYTLSLHDALPIYPPALAETTRGAQRRGLHLVRTVRPADPGPQPARHRDEEEREPLVRGEPAAGQDRKSTRLNSSHVKISYAVFCLKKKRLHNKKT